MFLQRIHILNFKNYEETTLDFCPKINCFFGENGVGKTNILDAIHYLSLTKSYFNSIDYLNINHDRDFFTITGHYSIHGEKEEIYCGLQKGKKKVFKRNKKDYQKLAEHIGLIPIVMISPNDSVLITSGSEERRKFMDIVISQYDHEYLHAVMNYNKILQQRNTLLKSFAKNNKTDFFTLDIYDEQLVKSGVQVHEKRKEFIEKLVPVFYKYYKEIAQDKEVVGLAYNSQLNDADFSQLLVDNRNKDVLLQYSSVGIHKDDLGLMLGERYIKILGSQGQQKTYLTALKFAKFEFIKAITGVNPILLLDDIFDKFDETRVEQIIKLVSDNHFGQIFITDTNKDRLDEILKKISFEHKIFHIHRNLISEA